jgi:adenylosuccinate synthase
MLNGVTQMIMTKADVLDGFEELKMCTDYSINGETTRQVPYQMNGITIDPVLESFAGWNTDTTSIKSSEQLPEHMKSYIQYINAYVGAPVTVVSNGPGRDQIVHL